jgi:hypothetical protein
VELNPPSLDRDAEITGQDANGLRRALSHFAATLRIAVSGEEPGCPAWLFRYHIPGILGLSCGESLATLLGRAGLARLWDTTKSDVVSEKKLAGVQGFRFETRAVGGDEPPMSDFAAQQVDETK